MTIPPPKNPFFYHCRDCDTLWQGPVNECWLCSGTGSQCSDSFVYTAPSMNQATSEP